MAEFYTAQEISKMMKISYQKALSLIRYSGMRYIKIGRQYRVSVDAFNEFTKSTNVVETN